MNYTFLYHMKMVSAKLKMLTQGVHVTVSVISMVLIQMKATEISPPDNLTLWIITA